MSIDTIFVEDSCRDHPRTKNILAKLPHKRVVFLNNYEDVFSRFKKPYLDKRKNLNVFIARKKGTLVKKAPEAYGTKGDLHYYFIHAYNCIYECEYCYLQSYFNSPDLVFFINHEDIAAKIREICSKNKNQHVWFHAGEFSDSLAMAHVSNEWPFYFDLFRGLPNASLELRSKSINIHPLLELSPFPNTIISFSLSPKTVVGKIDLKTPPLNLRLGAIQKLVKHGYRIGIHLDPVIQFENYEIAYKEFLEDLARVLPDSSMIYLSIGVLRFPTQGYADIKKNYPDSILHQAEFHKGFDGKWRLPRPLRTRIIRDIESLCVEMGFSRNKIYRCMEDTSSPCEEITTSENF